jgi:hypothetical protein
VAGLVDLLADVKPYLRIVTQDQGSDAILQGIIDAATPVIEDIVGPVLPRSFTEFFDGGLSSIVVRHPPIVSVESVIEFRGPIAYTLTQVANPSLGTVYSYTFEPYGRIVRRGVGGDEIAFPNNHESVQVIYTGGLPVVPPNVRLATLELIRHNYQLSQQAGRPAFAGAGSDEDAMYTPSGFAVPYRVIELCGPNKRPPSVA